MKCISYSLNFLNYILYMYAYIHTCVWTTPETFIFFQYLNMKPDKILHILEKYAYILMLVHMFTYCPIHTCVLHQTVVLCSINSNPSALKRCTECYCSHRKKHTASNCLTAPSGLLGCDLLFISLTLCFFISFAFFVSYVISLPLHEYTFLANELRMPSSDKASRPFLNNHRH